MQGSWWTKIEQMDEHQRLFVQIGPDGKHLLVGPPGCGKTNLLVMRARYIYGSGLKNVLLLTFTRSLQDFIKTGVAQKKYLEPGQVQTFKSWALKHIRTYAGEQLEHYNEAGTFEEQRLQILAMLKIANQRLGGKNLYDAVLVDEVQDLLLEEIEALLAVSERVTVAGDAKQMVYESGQSIEKLEALGFAKSELRFHYRIGAAIADVADKALDPNDPALRLRRNCNYPEHDLASRADLHEYSSRQEQFDAMYKNIERQLRSYPNEGIGIIVPRRFLMDELRQMFANAAPLSSGVAFHDEEGDENTFSSGKFIHAIPLKSSKGAEFRAVHLFGLEELKYPQHRRELVFTAVTRAKTTLDGYHSGKILASVASAFAKPPATLPTTEELL